MRYPSSLRSPFRYKGSHVSGQRPRRRGRDSLGPHGRGLDQLGARAALRARANRAPPLGGGAGSRGGRGEAGQGRRLGPLLHRHRLHRRGDGRPVGYGAGAGGRGGGRDRGGGDHPPRPRGGAPAPRAGHGEPGRRRSADARGLHLHRHPRHRRSLRQPLLAGRRAATGGRHGNGARAARGRRAAGRAGRTGRTGSDRQRHPALRPGLHHPPGRRAAAPGRRARATGRARRRPRPLGGLRPSLHPAGADSLLGAHPGRAAPARPGGGLRPRRPDRRTPPCGWPAGSGAAFRRRFRR